MTALTVVQLVEVFVDFRPKLVRVLFNRLGCRQTAQDVAQELYLKLHRIADRFPTQEDARRYLLRMAVNAATDYRRVEGRRAELLAGVAEIFAGAHAGPEEEVVAGDQIARVEEALNELPSRCRDILYMSRIEGMTHEEIAKALDVSQSLVEKYATRALLHCRARLTKLC